MLTIFGSYYCTELKVTGHTVVGIMLIKICPSREVVIYILTKNLDTKSDKCKKGTFCKQVLDYN